MGNEGNEALRITLTDPARELVELCEALYPLQGRHLLGEDHCAKIFEVEVWSKQFYQIIFTVSERIELVASLIGELEIDLDYRDEIVAHVRDILSAFKGGALRDHWEAEGQACVGPKNVQPLKAVSGLVRTKVSYKKLSDDEVRDTLNQVGHLLQWLRDHQLSERDFLRQALIDGLDQFVFRLEKVKWLGWGYALESLREVISAYVMLERSGVTPEINPDAAVMLKFVRDTLRSIHERVQVAKGAYESGEFLLKLYGAGALWNQAKPVVTGLLTGA